MPGTAVRTRRAMKALHSTGTLAAARCRVPHQGVRPGSDRRPVLEPMGRSQVRDPARERARDRRARAARSRRRTTTSASTSRTAPRTRRATSRVGHRNASGCRSTGKRSRRRRRPRPRRPGRRRRHGREAARATGRPGSSGSRRPPVGSRWSPRGSAGYPHADTPRGATEGPVTSVRPLPFRPPPLV